MVHNLDVLNAIRYFHEEPAIRPVGTMASIFFHVHGKRNGDANAITGVRDVDTPQKRFLWLRPRDNVLSMLWREYFNRRRQVSGMRNSFFHTYGKRDAQTGSGDQKLTANKRFLWMRHRRGALALLLSLYKHEPRTVSRKAASFFHIQGK